MIDIFGNVYKGHFYHGSKHGECFSMQNDGSYYIGKMRNNRKNGYGVLTTEEFVYKGGFKDDYFEGLGAWDLKGTGVFQGNFQNGEPYGEGSLLKDGNLFFKGEFFGRNSCVGEIKFSRYDRYVGEVSYFKPEGKGVYTTREERYEGEFKNGKYEGQGVLEM